MSFQVVFKEITHGYCSNVSLCDATEDPHAHLSVHKSMPKPFFACPRRRQGLYDYFELIDVTIIAIKTVT